MNFIAEITLKDSELMKIPGVKEWLDDVKGVINKNIENEYKKHLDLVIFGSSFEDENGTRINPADVWIDEIVDNNDNKDVFWESMKEYVKNETNP